MRDVGKGRFAAAGVLLAAVVLLVAGIRIVGVRRDAAVRQEPYAALPAALPHRADAAAVGMRLFQSRLLVGCERTCGSCHRLDAGGTDGRIREGRRTPSVLCAGLTRVDLETVCARMITYASGCATNVHTRTEHPSTRIRRDPVLRRALEGVYGDRFKNREPIDALAHYLRTLVPPRAAFDRYLSGRSDALTSEAKRGFELFDRSRCARCHGGVALGGKSANKTSGDGLTAASAVPLALRGLRFRDPFPGEMFRRMPGVAELSAVDIRSLETFLRGL